MSDNISVSKNNNYLDGGDRSEGEGQNGVLPQNFNKFITALELRVVKLLEYLMPEQQ